jgi:putative membrane protein
MAAYYDLFKAIHIIFFVSWFAGLFYIIRLFIYHVEAFDRRDEERKVLQEQYKIMERRLMRIITTPAMILTLLSGIGMLFARPYLLQFSWMYLKFGLLLLLFAYHGSCSYMMRKLKHDIKVSTSIRLRMWNEVATLLLVAVVFVAVFKDLTNWLWGVAGLVALGVVFMIIIRAVRNKWDR